MAESLVRREGDDAVEVEALVADLLLQWAEQTLSAWGGQLGGRQWQTRAFEKKPTARSF
jgi:hypothetical protein